MKRKLHKKKSFAHLCNYFILLSLHSIARCVFQALIFAIQEKAIICVDIPDHKGQPKNTSYENNK